jgi:hypothetical protein
MLSGIIENIVAKNVGELEGFVRDLGSIQGSRKALARNKAYLSGIQYHSVGETIENAIDAKELEAWRRKAIAFCETETYNAKNLLASSGAKNPQLFARIGDLFTRIGSTARELSTDCEMSN